MTTPWLETVLEQLRTSNDVGASTADFLRKKGTSVRFGKQSTSTAARWTWNGAIEINPRYFSENTPTSDPLLLSLLVHEVRHIQQGMVTALSVYGELDAWQTGYAYYKSLRGSYPNQVIVELCKLPLDLDRAVLQEARELMQLAAGTGYRIDLLPLYPLHKEIGYQIKRIF